MGETKKYSMYIRIVSGLLGVSGFASMVFNGLRAEIYEFGLIHLAVIFAGCIFLLVAATGKNPMDIANRRDNVDR